MKTNSTFRFFLPVNQFDNSVSLVFIVIVDIFHPSGADPTYPPISLQSLRCSPFEVVYYIFMGHGLAFAAISARE